MQVSSSWASLRDGAAVFREALQLTRAAFALHSARASERAALNP